MTNCLATIRSNNLDNMDKLELGRYNFKSTGLKPTFFTISVIYADLRVEGTLPFSNDQQKSGHKNGANKSILAFNSRVNIGSDEHSLSGNANTSLVTFS